MKRFQKLAVTVLVVGAAACATTEPRTPEPPTPTPQPGGEEPTASVRTGGDRLQPAVMGAAGPSVDATGSVALTGATVYPVSGPPIEDAVLFVQGDRIVGLGPTAETEPSTPPDEEIDVSGKHVYPAFVHPGSILGLVEIGSVAGTRDYREMTENNANLRAEVAFNADSMLLPVAASGGILTAHIVLRGGTFTGTSAVMRIDGWNWQDMTVEAPVAMHLDFPNMLPRRTWGGQQSEEEAKKEREEALELIDDTIAEARAYRKAVEAADRGEVPRPPRNPRLEALIPVLGGELPLWIHADEKLEIDAALDWVEENGFENIVLVSGPDAAYVADRLAARDVPVLLNGVNRLPRRDWEPYDAAYTAAATLHEAGVRFAIGDGFEASDVRNLPFEAAMAAAHGLDEEAALKSVTLWSAELLGVDDRLGSLEAGKEATFIVTDGDPLEIRTQIEQAWVAGRPYDLRRDRQKRLYERYRQRPRPGG